MPVSKARENRKKVRRKPDSSSRSNRRHKKCTEEISQYGEVKPRGHLWDFVASRYKGATMMGKMFFRCRRCGDCAWKEVKVDG